MANTLHNYGTELAYCATQNGTYTDAAGVREVTPPELTASETDVTHLTSPNFTREIIPSWRNPGEAGFVFLMHRSQYAALKTIWDARTLYYWHVTLPVETGDTTGSVLEFQARIRGMKIRTIAVGDEPILVEVTFAVVGGMTFTAGAA